MVGGYLRVLRLLPPLKLVANDSWNIAENGVKTPKNKKINQSYDHVLKFDVNRAICSMVTKDFYIICNYNF
jgi:hypothetical protein